MALPRQILLLGPPGAGKGTQGKRLGHRLGLACCATGNVLRQEEQRPTPRGERIHRYLKQGQFVPDDLVVEMVCDWIQEVNLEFILDGFPRTLAQGIELDRYLSALASPPALAIFLDVPGTLLEQRVADRVGCDPCGLVWARAAAPSRCPECGDEVGARRDDSVDLFRSRLAEYRQKTLPLLPHYEDNGRLRRICGQGSPETVFQRILNALDS